MYRVGVWPLSIEYLLGESNIVANLLSRSPPEEESKEADIDSELNDTSFSINAINSNEINPKHYTEISEQNMDVCNM